MKKITWLSVAATVLSCWAARISCLADITITPPDVPIIGPWNHWVGHYCSVGSCAEFCLTRTHYYNHIDAPAVGSDFDNAFAREYGPAGEWTRAPWNGAPWTLVERTPLNGTLTVNQYAPVLCTDRTGAVNHCVHGATLVMDYNPLGAFPVGDVRFVQSLTVSGWGCGYNGYVAPLPGGLGFPAGAPGIDPQPDHNFNVWFASRPFYPNWGRANNHFEDVPRTGCFGGASCNRAICARPICAWTTSFETYVARNVSDAAGNKIEIHDGLAWGFDSVCLGGPNQRNGAPAGGANPGASVSYNPATRVLSVGNSTIDVLNLDGSSTMDPAFAGDPIFGATISVSDFTFLGEGDGAYVFAGGTYTISKGGTTFFQAEVPYLLIDEDSLYTDDLYAPFVNPVFNLSANSAWLAAFESASREEDFYPEFRRCTAKPTRGMFGRQPRL